jgi:hypothetical protein
VTAMLHDVPTAGELVEAVREFLEDELMASLDGRARFHAQVAMNALAIVERELGQGGADVRAHQERLIALGYADDAGLASALRSGAEERWDEVRDAVAESVAAKLRVANPRYLEARA